MKRHTISGMLAAVAVTLVTAGSPAVADGVVAVKLLGESHDKMSVEVSPATVPAGKITFEVTNAAQKTGHEMILVKLPSKDAKLPLDPAKHRVVEKAVTSLGEVSNLKAGASGVLKANVAPGDYMLLCNIKGHYEAGMASPLTVTP